MKSVLHIRIDSAGFISDAMAAAFIANGYEYYSLNWQAHRFEFGVESLRQKVIQMAEYIKPSIIFCHIQNSEAFDLATWQELTKYSFVVNYTFDVRSKEKIEWMYEVAKYIGHTFFACQEDVNECKTLGLFNTSAIHSSCDMEIFKPDEKNNNKAFDVVFCGTNYEHTNLEFPLAAERQRMVEFLQKNYESRFMSYGHGQKGGLIRAEVEAKVYNFSRIGISHNNFNKKEYNSDRLWRIMASGCFCLAKYFDGIEKVFQKEVDLDWWETFDELKDLIDFYLSNEEERMSIAETGCKLVRSKHTWSARIAEMEKYFAVSENKLHLV